MSGVKKRGYKRPLQSGAAGELMAQWEHAVRQATLA